MGLHCESPPVCKCERSFTRARAWPDHAQAFTQRAQPGGRPRAIKNGTRIVPAAGQVYHPSFSGTEMATQLFSFSVDVGCNKLHHFTCLWTQPRTGFSAKKKKKKGKRAWAIGSLFLLGWGRVLLSDGVSFSFIWSRSPCRYIFPSPSPPPRTSYFEVLFISSEETETRLCRNGLFYYLKIEKNDNWCQNKQAAF